MCDQGVWATEIEGVLRNLVEHRPGLGQHIAFVEHQRVKNVQGHLGAYPASVQHGGLYAAGRLKPGEGRLAMAQGQLQRAFYIDGDAVHQR
ncbi:hypothetical protein D3C77_384760 [compost metagenome]